MGFIRVQGIQGLVYTPEETHGLKKHDCPDCYACQMCSDIRCELCLKAQTCARCHIEDPED